MCFAFDATSVDKNIILLLLFNVKQYCWRVDVSARPNSKIVNGNAGGIKKEASHKRGSPIQYLVVNFGFFYVYKSSNSLKS